MKYFRKAVLPFFLIVSFGKALTLQSLLQEDSRPLLTQTMQVSSREIQGANNNDNRPAHPACLKQIYEHIVAKLLTFLPEREIVLVGRDMEDVFDSFHAALEGNPDRDMILEKIHLVGISRKLAENASLPQISEWLRIHGVDLDEVYRGNKKYLFLDTGYVGRVFSYMFRNIFSRSNAPFGLTDQEFALNVLTGLDTRVLAAWETRPYMDRLIEEVRTRGVELSKLRERFAPRAIYFRELFSNESELVAAGLPVDNIERGEWIIRNLERLRRNWSPRILRLSQDGSYPAVVEQVTARDARVSRVGVLKYQLEIADYFAHEEVKRHLTPVVGRAIEKLKLNGNVSLRDDNSFSEFPELGRKFKAINGEIYSVNKVAFNGDHSRILRATSGSAVVAIKVPIDDSDDAIERLSRDRRRQVRLADLGFSAPQIIEASKNYTIRPWIDGPTLKQWLKENGQDPNIESKSEFQGIKKFLQKSISLGVYVSNLSASNLIWNGDDWVIIDSSSVLGDLSLEEVKKRYDVKIRDQWPQGHNLCLNLLNGDSP